MRHVLLLSAFSIACQPSGGPSAENRPEGGDGVDSAAPSDTASLPDTASAEELPRCLAAHWPFDDVDGRWAAESTGLARDGLLRDDAHWVGGADGGAVSLDGDGDAVEMGNALDELELPVTVSAWVWVEPQDYFRVVNSDDDASIYAGFYMATVPGGYLHAGFGDGTGGGGYQWRRSATAAQPLPERAWINVAAVIRGAEDIQLYVDGARVAASFDGTGGSMRHSPAFPMRVGRTAASAVSSKGAIDDLRVYDCALTPAEIFELASAGG